MAVIIPAFVTMRTFADSCTETRNLFHVHSHCCVSMIGCRFIVGLELEVNQGSRFEVMVGLLFPLSPCGSC